MFHSFFPNPRIFFPACLVWTGLSMAVWFIFGADLGEMLSLGGLIGYGYPEAPPPEADEMAMDAYANARLFAVDIWLYQYMIFVGAIFAFLVNRLLPHRWFWWSVVVASIIIFITWFLVQLDVMINNWFGRFYDAIQMALGDPGSISITEYYLLLLEFLEIAMVFVIVASINRFIVSHFIFRWRTAMNDYYVANWQKLRHIEGASQRVQEDTMRFASIMESLGVSLIDALMTLIAFLPILWALSEHVKELPIIGEVPQALVIIAVVWSVFGTGLVALAGIRLPGLEFRNQRVEAAYRKELVFGEDDPNRAQPPRLSELFADVRRNYFRLYLNYLYFNLVRISYLQVGVLVPYFALGPTIVSATITLGVLQQIVRAFGRVESSFQYLINSWTTIVEMMSIYKRLHAFEATMKGRELADIERDSSPA